MDFRLELLDDSTFEKLVNRVCQDILGLGVVSFSAGKDGGRDGKFTGTANKYPSEKHSWTGKFIIQAKFTENPIASCSDSSFKKTLDTEIAKIKTLKITGDVDCYMLFTNRKYSGVEGERILKKIQTETGVKNVVIIGKETMNDLYLNNNKDIIREFQLDMHHIPFDFSEAEIRDMIVKFHTDFPLIQKELASEIDKIQFDFNRIKIEEKNKRNFLGKEYFENEILSHSLQDFEKIESFLGDPRNDDYKEQYFDIAAELRNLIQLKRANFAAFEEIFIFIYKQISDGNRLKGKRRIFTLLHYMYYECLIGIK